MAMMMTRVMKARNKFIGEAKSGDFGLPPPIQLTATGSRVIPMMVMIVPVTTGGKKRMNRLKKGAMKKVNSPAMRIDP